MLGKLKGLIFVDESADKQTENITKPAPAVQPQVQAAPQVVVTAETPSINAPEIKAAIENLIAQQEQFQPYVAFKKAADSLAAVIADEPTRFKAAAATSQVTRDVLVNALTVVTPILEGERKNFNDRYIALQQSTAQGKQQAIEALDVQIQELTAKLAELADTKNKFAAEITDIQAQMFKANVDFENVIKSIHAEFEGVNLKVQQFVGA